jgi:glucokinase
VPGAFEGRPSRILELAGDIAKVTAKEVGEAAQRCDALALDVIERVARIIGLGFVNMLHLYDPALIMVGGSVALMGDVLLDPVRKTVERYAMAPYRGVPIVPAQLGDDGGLLGAAALALQQQTQEQEI